MVHDVVFIASLVTLGIGVTGVVMGFLAGYFKGGEPDYGGPICGVGFIMIVIAFVGFFTDARMQLRAWRGGLFTQGELDIREVMITLGVAMFAMTLVCIVIEGVGYYRWHSGSITEFIARRSLQPLISLMVVGLVMTATGLMMPLKYSESEVPARLPVPPERLCATCNRSMTWNPQYQRWFCQYCQRYA